ncbi:AAA family ATPase [Streptomyces orinoci]|uniref:AAA family ATPase n=1 Tax=Streptomyces orinoci TaxID=67339 RepID=A0ABV3K5M7_STRON|nr:AAA family ATPase [Streptomyces orinoci]
MSVDTSMPHDDELERCVLGCVVCYPDRFADLSLILEPDDFYNPAHSILWSTLGQRLERGEPVDPPALTAALAAADNLRSAGGPAYVSALPQYAVPDATWHADEVKRLARLRAARQLGARLMQATAQPGAELTDLAALVVDALPVLEANDSSGRASRPVFWTADALYRAEFPEPRWAVPDLIPEGLTVLTGAPKVGKSWICLGLGLAVATGGKALDAIPVQQGEALYLALEDTPRRMQSRLHRVLGDQPPPEALHIHVELPAGLGGIRRWLDQHPTARLVIVDVLQRVRSDTGRETSAYAADYAAITALKRLADAYQVAFIVVHHIRKAQSADWMDATSGTNGINGAADATLYFSRARGEAEGLLNLTGRDVEENEYALRRSEGSMTWHLMDGPADIATATEPNAKILAHLHEHGPATPKEVAAATGQDPKTVRTLMGRLRDRGRLTQLGQRGPYAIPGQATALEGNKTTGVASAVASVSPGQRGEGNKATQATAPDPGGPTPSTVLPLLPCCLQGPDQHECEATGKATGVALLPPHPAEPVRDQRDEHRAGHDAA